MKYHEKLNLKSPIYKYSNNNVSRTPTKSPLKLSPNPIEMFQKVCCPNCKYAFKIIKQQIIKQHPLQISNAITQRNRVKQKKSTQVQTQNDPIIPVNNSPIKTQKSYKRLSRSPGLHANQNIDNYKVSRVREILQDEKSAILNSRDSGYKFKPLMTSPKDRIGNSDNLLQTLHPKILSADPFKIQDTFNLHHDIELRTPRQEKFEFNFSEEIQQRESYVESPKQSNYQLPETHKRKNSYPQPIMMEHKEDVSENRSRSQTGMDSVQRNDMNFSKKQKIQSSFQQIGIVTQKEPNQSINDPAFMQFILQTLIKSDQNHQIMLKLQQFCRTINQEVQVPSYCKMLAFSQ